MRAALGGPMPPAMPDASPELPETCPDASRGPRIVDEARAEVRRIRPSCRVRALWVSFRQDVWVGVAGSEVRFDSRRGERLRLEVEVDGVSGAARGVEELTFSGDPMPATKLRRCAERAVLRAESRTRASAGTPGEREVVFAAGVGGVLLHELVGHALEADAAGGNRGWLAAGPALGSALTVVDDPRRGRAPWRVDDEGQSVRPVPLLRDGRVAGGLCDLLGAGQAARPTTGHGRRSSFRDPVHPRMGCTFLAPGRVGAEEVVGETRNGIYVRRMEAGTTDPATGRAVFRVTDADTIVDGRIGRALLPLLLVVDGKTALSAVDRVADDLAFDTCVGSCHRHGQPLPISVGAPTFCIGLATVIN
ncbi:MAG: TldD/PmbA family protein [bacterium]|nr:TldD/PmbA family protein [bacterium]